MLISTRQKVSLIVLPLFASAIGTNRTFCWVLANPEVPILTDMNAHQLSASPLPGSAESAEKFRTWNGSCPENVTAFSSLCTDNPTPIWAAGRCKPAEHFGKGSFKGLNTLRFL